jgi:transcriptional regulator with XRE-family HTH domain
MSRKNWKRRQPTSALHAFRLCKDYAREVRHLSVERIADLMSVTHDTLYKWLANGRMPAVLIPTYEMACGIDFVSRWLVISGGGRLVIEVPTGKKATAVDIHELQELLNAAVGQLIQFHGGKAEAPECLAAIQQAMEGLALHRGQVQKHAQPELDFGMSD